MYVNTYIPDPYPRVGQKLICFVFGNLGCLPLKRKCDEIEVERCVEEERK
jgi:hypothetical protein